MKNLLLLAIITFGFTAVSFGQVTATASAIINANGAITLAGNMNFGNLTSTPAGGTIELNAETGARTPTGGVTIPNGVAGVAATFNISGTANTLVEITLPSGDFLITKYQSSETMTVRNFTSFPVLDQDNKINLGNSGAVLLKVGATLVTGSNPKPGLYESLSTAAFPVTANFN